MSVETLIDRLTEIRKAEIVTITSLKGKPEIYPSAYGSLDFPHLLQTISHDTALD